ncbi:cysteine proteinase [Lentithecium fluviatile CBS 122367]|uniref:ubiquitinyl hydrolase 1 n=1 Tax=Lentithecium fluviatile CBS 122367 TaxID=1168545 RepID=A0A6G1IU53_9PLEO|nr:cysteine proteinase [Lentithecium fluviatile CBS 122367]
MGDFDEEDRLYAAYNDRRFNQTTSTTGVGPTLLTAAAGLYILFRALESLGFPVRLWVHMTLEKVGQLRLQGVGSTDSGEDSEDSEMQRGGMFGSLFGLNSSSLLQKGVRGVTGALGKGSSDVPPGLGNYNNSCYQNSVIQGLAALPTLRSYLSETTAEFRSLDTETTNGALFDMIGKLNDPENHGQHFWVSGKLKNMSTFTQQDAQEYYSKILDALDKEVQGATNSRRRSSASWLEAAKSLVDSRVNKSSTEDKVVTEGDAEDAKPSPEQRKITPNPLDGLLAQRVGCINCGYSEGLQLIPFNCVTVSLGRGYTYDIRDCLDEYTQLEYIEGVECAKCTLLKVKATLAPLVAGGAPFGARLQAVEEALEDDDFDDKTLVKKFNILKKNWVQSTKSRQAVIARAPKALVLHVNRSIFDEMTGTQYKNTAAVAYPRVLDLGHWCLGSQPSASHLPDNDEEEWPRDPTKSMIGDIHVESSSRSPFQYQLRAAVTHFGTHGSGHYVCYRSRPRKRECSSSDEEEAGTEQWWRFSDDSVYAVPEAQAHQGNVFMLFYELADESTLALLEGQKAAQAMVAVEDDIPLPPSDFSSLFEEGIDDTAASVALPEDDDESLPDLVPSPEAPTPSATASQSSTPEHRPTTPSDPKVSEVDISAYLTPPPESPTNIPQPDTKESEADSPIPPQPETPVDNPQSDTEEPETGSPGAPSINATPEDEVSPSPATPRSNFSPSPHLMRTAGQSPGRGDSRRTLPMVAAT